MKDLRLVNKLNRRMKLVRKSASSPDHTDKINKLEEVMAGSPAVYKLAIKVQRKLDSKMGADMVGQKPMLSFSLNAATIERFDYGVSDFGIRITLAAGMIAAVGIRPNDVLMVLEGALKGYMLKVVAVTNSTQLRCEDVSLGKPEITSLGCIADSAGSLDGTYFTLNSAANATAYYVWMDVDAGGNDPAPMGLTGIPVAIASNDSAATVAAAVAAAIEANADFTASSSSQNVRIQNIANGIATDAADVDSGFSVSILQQGSANSMASESDKQVRFELSTVKKSYV